MRIELDQRLFRRLVLLDLILLVPSLAIGVLEASSEPWQAFEGAFAEASTDTLGGPFAIADAAYVVLGLAILLWFVSSLGLLRFRRWARTGYLVASLLILILDPIASYPVSYSGWLIGPLDSLEGLLSGGILLLAYARGLGDEWFALAPAARKD